MREAENYIKCYKSELVDVTYKTWHELFYGFDTIKAITFSYDIGFIDQIMNLFSYGEIILGGSFMTLKDNKMQSLLAEIYTNQLQAGKAIRKHKVLADRVLNESIEFRTPRSFLDHRKLFLLKSDRGNTRVIVTSANMTKRAWKGDQIETYQFYDSKSAYDAFLEDFDTAWDLSDTITPDIVSSKKAKDTDDLLVFCKHFLQKIAKQKCRSLQNGFVGCCTYIL